ncbi:MAG: lantibiotic dehydratase [Pseudonocardiales bacterium]|nr:lantibiotic dehydratase [Pseudonocardiales bacterium]
MRQVWAEESVAEGVEVASPVLARRMEAVCAGQRVDARQVRRTVSSVTRYLLRMRSRATPFGLFAGVATVRFGLELTMRWGRRHRAVARADAAWLTDVITRLESYPQLLARLPVVANNLCFVRGVRLIVPYQPHTRGASRVAPGEVSMRHTRAVQIVMQAARSSIRCGELAGKLGTAFPNTPGSVIDGLLAELVARRVLVSSLHAPATVTDAFGYVLDALTAVDAGDIPQVAPRLRELRMIQAELALHNCTYVPKISRGVRKSVADRMRAVSDSVEQPLAVDLRLDCEIVLPKQVAREAEAAASVLMRLTAYPFGTEAWQDYHEKFLERYGIGSLVPIMELVDADAGLGFPAGYQGSVDEPCTRRLSARDERLLALAQQAALDGSDEIVLDERGISALAAGDLAQAQVPPHIELCAQIQAASPDALGRGDFDLVVVSTPRAAGTMAGRFIDLLDASDRYRMAQVYAQLPTSDAGAMAVQLSCLPLYPRTENVIRAPALLPRMISLAEHRTPSDSLIPVEDLAVGGDRRRLYLVSLSQQRQLEPTVLHALDFRAQMPPIARFLCELVRAQAGAYTGFDWGAASRLPFLPRVRHGRTVLSPARWNLSASDLPAPGIPWPHWTEAIASWRRRCRLPAMASLCEGDRRIRLDFNVPAHLALLRSQLDRTGHATLAEAPDAQAHGWLDGRPHEIVIPLVTAGASAWLPIPRRSAPNLVIGRDHGHVPGCSRWFFAKLYAHPDRQSEILAEYLPRLLSTWDSPPEWWFVRYRDPEPHLRLRIRLPGTHEYGHAASRVGAWTADMRRLGLVRHVQLDTYYPETARYGTGRVMSAAETAFAADSHAVVIQLAQAHQGGLHRHAITAANFVDIAAGFTGAIRDGMRWLVDHAKTEPATPPLRKVVTESIRLADPGDDWAALRRTPGGETIIQAWRQRRGALAAYRAQLSGADGIEPDSVLTSLLHVHHNRASGIDKNDERVCLRLARAAARAWIARAEKVGQ